MEDALNKSTKKTSATRFALLIVLFVLLAIFVAMIVAISYFAFFVMQDNSSVPSNPDIDNTLNIYQAEITEAFWANNDRERAREILEEAVKKFETGSFNAENVSPDLNELSFKMRLAGLTIEENPEKGLRLYAEMFFDQANTVTERAQALFAAMQYVTRELPVDESSLATAKELVFGPDGFGPILNEIEYSHEEISSPYELRLAALAGIRHAADTTGSYRIRGHMLSVEYRFATALEVTQIHQEITGVPDQAASQDEINAYLDDNQVQTDRLDVLLTDTRDHYSQYMLTLVNNTELFTDFIPDITYSLNNILRAYNAFAYLGYDVFSELSEIYTTGQSHLDRYDPDAMEFSLASNYQLQIALQNLAMACGHVLTVPALSGNVTAEYLAPVLALSDANKERLSITNDETDVCHKPLIYMGIIHEDFQDLLVNNVGGWQRSQFTLTP